MIRVRAVIMLHALKQGKRARGTLAEHADTDRVIAFQKDMSIIAALGLHPEARAVFEQHGMACSICIGASTETIEAGAIMHGVEPDDIVAALNGLLPDH